jgi:hypothetical protein
MCRGKSDRRRVAATPDRYAMHVLEIENEACVHFILGNHQLTI